MKRLFGERETYCVGGREVGADVLNVEGGVSVVVELDQCLW